MRTIDERRPDDDARPPDDVVTAAHALVDALATDVVVLDVEAILALTGHFVIGSAPNTRLVRRLVDDVEAKVAEAHGRKPLRTEGVGEWRWVLMDYGDFVVHVFLDETREFYALERLWSDVASWRPEPDPARRAP